MMEDSHKEKQQYLRDAILSKNYDPEHFAQFLQNSKPDGDDIDKWPLSELKEVVELYIKTNQPTATGQKQSHKGHEEDSDDENGKSNSFQPTSVSSPDKDQIEKLRLANQILGQYRESISEMHVYFVHRGLFIFSRDSEPSDAERVEFRKEIEGESIRVRSNNQA